MIKNNTNYKDLSNEVGEMLTHSKYVRSYNELLAKELNKTKAILINQIHYWTTILRDEKHFHDGRYWVYESYKSWQKQFPSMTARQIQNILISLEEDGYILVGNFNEKEYDKTKWYTVNYEKVKEALSKQEQNQEKDHGAYEKISSPPYEKVSIPPYEQSSSPIPNISIPNNSIPNNSYIAWSEFEELKHRSPDHKLRDRLFDFFGMDIDLINDMDEIITYFFEKYRITTGKNHEYIVSDQSFEKPTRAIASVVMEFGKHEVAGLIRRYFEDFQSQPWRLSYWHFATNGILRNRMREEGHSQSSIDSVLGKEALLPF